MKLSRVKCGSAIMQSHWRLTWLVPLLSVPLMWLMFAFDAAHSQDELDVQRVFWCESGKNTGKQSELECVESRELILTHCTGCHAITPIVKAQKNRQQWAGTFKTHKGRLRDLSEADLNKARAFLEAHFNPENPVPKLPPELEQLSLPPA